MPGGVDTSAPSQSLIMEKGNAWINYKVLPYPQFSFDGGNVEKKFFVAYVVSQVVKISHFNQDSSACFIKAFKLKKAYE